VVVLRGKNKQSPQLSPVGVGRLNNRIITSVGRTHFETMDYFAYVLVDEKEQAVLKKYVDSDMDIRELISDLRKESE